MNRKIQITLFVILFLFYAIGFSQSKKAIEIGFEDTIHSNILGQDRPIQICLPGDYESSTKSYPIMILCDGQWNFVHTAGIVGFMSGNGVTPEMILIGIVHANRDDDLVPATVETDDYSGKASDFLNFLGKELIPYIEGKYRTQPFHILAGISYGGLFTHYAMITQPNLFNAYIAADPSLWWDNQKVIRDSEVFFKSIDTFNKTIYFTQSQIPVMGGDVFARMLQRSAPRGLKWKFNHMYLETHGSITHRSFYDGLEFIYSDWSPESVKIEPQGDIFMKGDTVLVTMEHPEAEKIYYTLNGTEPDQKSLIYQHAFKITQPVTIQTKAYFSHGVWGEVATKTYQYAVLQPADKNAKNLKKGLAYQVFEGDWDQLPKFDEMKSTASGVADSIDVAVTTLQDQFGIRFDGFVDIPETAIYTFYLGSDDGSRLSIDQRVLIDNDGLHGKIEKAKQIYLEKGMHQIRVDFFEKGGGEMVELTYEKSGSKRMQLPAGDLYHQ